MQAITCVLVGDPCYDQNKQNIKTKLLVRYTTNSTPDEYVPTVFENYSSNVKIDGKPYNLCLYDSATQQEDDRLRPLSYPQTTDIFVVCFSVVVPSSFENVGKKWISEIQQYFPNVPFLLVGLENDLRDDSEVIESLSKNNLKPIEYEQGNELAKKIGAANYLECSLRTYEGINNIFKEAITTLFPHQQKKSFLKKIFSK